MAVAVLVDLGVPPAVVSGAVTAMGVRGLRVGFGRRRRGSFVGRSFDVDWPGRKPRQGRIAREDGHHHEHEHDHDHDHDHDHEHHGHAHPHEDAHVHLDADDHAHAHRDYAEVKRLLAKARLDADARALAGDIFTRIAEVEARLHGVRVDRVAFHEVGAFDSIADVVGFSAALAHLAPASIGAAPPVIGDGFVRTAHGVVPVPAPATAELLAGIPVRFDGEGELTTPTGAAILAAVVDRFGAPPPMRIRAVGYGAGTRELADRANLLRAVIGEPIGEADAPAAPEVVLLEANIDDMSPQLVAPLIEALLAAGAVDVWSAPILMKKLRPELQVSALAPPAAVAVVERAFFAHSTTLGVRKRPLERVVLARSFADIATPYGRVRAKVAALDGAVLGAQPEFEDCRRLAAHAGVPVREVLAAAAAAARGLLPSPALASAPARRKPASRGRRRR